MITTPIQSRFSDTDALGHVNNGSLQQYFDVGKSGYFKEVLSLPAVWKERGFVAVSTTTSYHKEVFLDDEIAVDTIVESIGTKSVTIYQEMKCQSSGEVKASSRSVLVTFDIVNHISIAVPESWVERINRHEQWER